MTSRKTASQVSNRGPLAAIGRIGVYGTLLLGALLALTLALAPRAEAYVYWIDEHLQPGPGEFTNTTIGRANLDGTGVRQKFVVLHPGAGGGGIALDDTHIYWATTEEPLGSEPTIGRANLDGTAADESFVVPANGVNGGVAVDDRHIYWTGLGSIGRANLDGTGVDRRFITMSRQDFTDWVAVDPLRSFSFGKVKKNEKKGSAKLTVKVPGPGTLKLANTSAVKGAEERAEAKGKAKLSVRPRGKAKQKLAANGKAKVKAEVTYRPQGGDPTIVANTDTKRVKLIKR